MALHAVDDIDDAIDATKEFLLPFEAGRWFRLALVVFFVGGGGGGLNVVRSLTNLNNLDGGGPNDGTVAAAAPLDRVAAVDVGPAQMGSPLPPGARETIQSIGAATLLAALVGIALLALAYVLLGHVMEFVLARSLIERSVHLRRYARTHAGDAARLLGFRLGVALVELLVLGAVGVAVFFLVFGGSLAGVDAAALLGSLGVLIPILVLYLLVDGLVRGFTNVFVVPLMLEGDHGVLRGWSRLWSSLVAAPKQYLGYVFFSVLLQIGTGIVAAFAGILAFIVLLIPLGILGAVVWFGLGEGLVSVALLAIVGVVFVLALLVIGLLVRAPLRTFLRYYAMLVLGDIDRDLDPLPAVREDLRA